jgi:hypothetical protein
MLNAGLGLRGRARSLATPATKRALIKTQQLKANHIARAARADVT